MCPRSIAVDSMNTEAIQKKIRQFVEERDWEKYHTPKNLAMALAGECGELLEIFQWLTPEESQELMKDPKKAKQVQHELADIMVYVLRLADKLEISLSDAIDEKLNLNAQKYPVHLSKGSSKKYTDL